MGAQTTQERRDTQISRNTPGFPPYDSSDRSSIFEKPVEAERLGPPLSRLEQFLTGQQSQGKAPSTIRNYRHALKALNAWLEAERKTEQTVSPADLSAFVEQVGERYPDSPDHCNQYVSAARVYFRCLIETRIIRRNPAENLKFRFAPMKPVDALSTLEIKALLSYVCQYRRGMKKGNGQGRGKTRWATYRAGVLTLFLIETGLRIGEALLLKTSDVNLTTASIEVYAPKTKDHRATSITPRLRPLLKAYLGSRSSFFMRSNLINYDAGWLFPAEHGGAWEGGRANRGVQGIAKAAGLKRRVYCHLLRHTWATHMLLNGCPLTTLQQMGGWHGHSAIAMVARYSHMNKEQLRRVHMIASPLESAIR